MPTSFPEIEPTDRSFNAPRWPTSSDTTKSGAITRRLWGSRPNSGQLSLKFQNTTDANAAAILAAYDNAKGSVDTLTLPAILFNGANANLKAWLDGSAHGAGLLWCFTEGAPPQVESIAPGRSTVTVNLTAELRTPSSPLINPNDYVAWRMTVTPGPGVSRLYGDTTPVTVGATTVALYQPFTTYGSPGLADNYLPKGESFWLANATVTKNENPTAASILVFAVMIKNMQTGATSNYTDLYVSDTENPTASITGTIKLYETVDDYIANVNAVEWAGYGVST